MPKDMPDKLSRDWDTFENSIGVHFKNRDLLAQAFIHRSFLNENPRTGLEHNERLEFLGDAVLELAVTDYLYREYPESPEGELTSYRAALVNANTMADFANEIAMNDYLFLSRGEAKDTGKARLYILANAIEALIGAIYMDQGATKSCAKPAPTTTSISLSVFSSARKRSPKAAAIPSRRPSRMPLVRRWLQRSGSTNTIRALSHAQKDRNFRL